MAIPKENRQQMINMMYIVLTALLALNVSAELLNAFALIKDSLSKSSETLVIRNQSVYQSFANKKIKEPANKDIILYEEKALKIKAYSKELQDYVEQLDAELLKEGGGIDPETNQMKKRDDVDLSTRFFVELNKPGGPPGKGYELKGKIEEILTKMMAEVDTAGFKTELDRLPFDITKGSDGTLTLNPIKSIDGREVDWVRGTFAQIPAIASQTMLTKIKSDILSTEGQLSSYMYRQLGDAPVLSEDEIVFDKFAAKIVAPTSYIMVGETFEAEIFLAAFNSKSKNINISVNGSGLPVNSDGVAFFKRQGTSPGEYPVSGSISVLNDRTGKSESYKLPEFKYTVAAPFATISPTKMNVFYIGVDNPVEVSAAGVRGQDLSVSISNGSISGNGGQYTVRVSSQGKATINVGTKGKSLTSKEFRVKIIPDPVAKVGNKAGGNMAAAEMRVQNGLAAILENFDFEAKYEVLGFQVTFVPRRQDPVSAQCNGPYFSEGVKGFQKQMKPGDTIYFEEIRVKGPDGTTRKIPGIVFKLT